MKRCQAISTAALRDGARDPRRPKLRETLSSLMMPLGGEPLANGSIINTAAPGPSGTEKQIGASTSVVSHRCRRPWDLIIAAAKVQLHKDDAENAYRGAEAITPDARRTRQKEATAGRLHTISDSDPSSGWEAPVTRLPHPSPPADILTTSDSDPDPEQTRGSLTGIPAGGPRSRAGAFICWPRPLPASSARLCRS